MMKRVLTILAFTMLGASGATYANLQECKFYDDGNQVLIMSPGTQPVITPLPVGTVTAPTLISNPILMETTPSLRSHCTSGQHEEDVFQLTNNAMLDGEIDGKATFSTNIPGIVYTLAFYPDGNGVTAWFPPNPNAFYRTASVGDESLVADKHWHVRMDFWQIIGFAGIPENENFLTASGGPIGQIVLGDPDSPVDDHPRPQVNMSQMSFSIPLNRPTCALRAPTTVNLGDWYPGDLENDNTDKVTFHITGTCANTTSIQYTLSSSHTTPDKVYFTNAIQEGGGIKVAKGVGVIILDHETDTHPVPADSFKRVIAMGEHFGDPVSIIDRTLWARLVKTGAEPISVGSFGTSITFQITYE